MGKGDKSVECRSLRQRCREVANVCDCELPNAFSSLFSLSFSA